MPELSANYSEGWGSLIKPNVCLKAMFFPVSPSLLLQLSSVASSLISLDEDVRITHGVSL